MDTVLLLKTRLPINALSYITYANTTPPLIGLFIDCVAAVKSYFDGAVTEAILCFSPSDSKFSSHLCVTENSKFEFKGIT